MSQLALSASFEYLCYGSTIIKICNSVSAGIDIRPRVKLGLNHYHFNVNPLSGNCVNSRF